jgi:hypothetical protein
MVAVISNVPASSGLCALFSQVKSREASFRQPPHSSKAQSRTENHSVTINVTFQGASTLKHLQVAPQKLFGRMAPLTHPSTFTRPLPISIPCLG